MDVYNTENQPANEVDQVFNKHCKLYDTANKSAAMLLAEIADEYNNDSLNNDWTFISILETCKEIAETGGYRWISPNEPKRFSPKVLNNLISNGFEYSHGGGSDENGNTHYEITVYWK